MKNYLWLVLLVFFAGVYSCIKNEEIEEIDDMQAFSVEEARTWFESWNSAELTLKSGELGEKGKKYKPDWESAFVTGNEKFEVVEMHILSNGAFGFATEESYDELQNTGEGGYMKSLTRLVIMKGKKTNEIKSFLMTIVGSTTYLKEKCYDLLANTYLKKDNDFSGSVFFHELDGSYANGWQFDNGKVTHEIKASSEADLPLQLKSTEVCVVQPYTVWYEICIDIYSIGYLEDVDWYGTPHYLKTECFVDFTHFYLEHCKIIDETGNISGGGSGEYISPTPTPELNPILKNYPCLDNILNTLMNGTNVDLKNLTINPTLTADILHAFKMSEAVNLTIRVANLGNVDVNGTTRKIDGNNYEIVLNETYVNSATDLSIARTMIHETIHANLLYKYDLRDKPFNELVQIHFNTMLSDPTLSDRERANIVQHTYMANNLVPIISNNLYEWCRQSSLAIDDTYCDKLSWGGLDGIYEFENLDNKLEIQQILINEKLNNFSAQGRKCNE